MTARKLLYLLLILLLAPSTADACTSAIIAAHKTKAGRPLLWKHRDTSTTDNVVEYIPAADSLSMAYVALFNARDKGRREAWVGMNTAGFAVMNTASYNIKDDDLPESCMDREGFLMTEALKRCRTVEDFRAMLDTLPRPLGVEANFGVIDADGNGAFFETNNHSYVAYYLCDVPDGVLVRTNYSHSGREIEGHGHVREANACHLLAPYIPDNSISPELLTETLSRSFYQDDHKRDFASTDVKSVVDVEFIPRYTSTATVVIEGLNPEKGGDPVDQYIMWTGMGYPPVAEIVPVFCRPDGVDPRLEASGEDGHSELGDKAKALRDSIFFSKRKDKRRYVDMTKLYNPAGTGYLQTLPQRNHEVYEKYGNR